MADEGAAPAVRVERAEASDADVHRLLEAHERDMRRRYPGGSWAGTSGRKDALWLARELDGRAVGCVAMRVLSERLVEVKHLFVQSQARRRGIGAALMDAVECEANRRDAEIVLETGTEQPEALALYERRGYRLRDRYPEADIDGDCSRFMTRARGSSDQGRTASSGRQ